MFGTSIERYLSGWKSHSYTWIEARKHEKVIIKLIGDKVISGVIYKVGTKNLILEVGQRLHGKRTIYMEWKTIKIEHIKELAKYPSGFQAYKDIKMN